MKKWSNSNKYIKRATETLPPMPERERESEGKGWRERGDGGGRGVRLSG